MCIRDSLLESGRSVVAEVTTICCAQRPGVARVGHASKVVDAVERLATTEARRRGNRACFLFAAAENSGPASNFWAKRGLLPGPVADHVTAHLINARAVLEYTDVTHVCLQLAPEGDDDVAPDDDAALLAGLGNLDLAGDDAPDEEVPPAASQ